MSDGGRWRRVYSLEWHASAFQGLSDSERVVYFYVRTGPQSTSVGIFRISSAVAVEDIGNLTAIEFDYRLDLVCQAFGWHFDSPTRVLWMPGWLDENPPQSPNVVVSWRKLIANLPDCDLKFEAAEAISQSLKDKPKTFREAFGSYPKDTRNSKAMPVSKTVSNQGAGDSGIQGSGSTGTGSRKKAGFEKRNSSSMEPLRSDVPTLLATTAREVFQVASGPPESLVDAFFELHRLNGRPPCSTTEALQALISQQRPM